MGAQEVAEDKTHHNPIPLVPSGHHSAPIKGRKTADKGRKDEERVNDGDDIVGELLFDRGLCSCCCGAASEDGQPIWELQHATSARTHREWSEHPRREHCW